MKLIQTLAVGFFLIAGVGCSGAQIKDSVEVMAALSQISANANRNTPHAQPVPVGHHCYSDFTGYTHCN